MGIGCRFRKSWLINAEGSGRELVGEGEKNSSSRRKVVP